MAEDERSGVSMYSLRTRAVVPVVRELPARTIVRGGRRKRSHVSIEYETEAPPGTTPVTPQYPMKLERQEPEIEVVKSPDVVKQPLKLEPSLQSPCRWPGQVFGGVSPSTSVPLVYFPSQPLASPYQRNTTPPQLT